jgi:hypothetical protein
LLKIQFGYNINAEFHADFESVEKVLKKCIKKVISKNMTEICTFFTFTYVCQTCFACNFFSVHFLQLFQRIQNQREIPRFLISFLVKKKIWVIFALFSNFEDKCAKNGSKNQKTYFVNVS